MTGFKLDGIFGDHMVLQRDEEIILWGLINGDEGIHAIFENKEYKASIRGERFTITLPAHEAGTDFEIQVKSLNKAIVLKDICIGDVFVLAGQSNMELPVGRTLDICGEEVYASDYPYIRQYRLTPQYRLDPAKLAELPDLPWTNAEPSQIMEMSALGFFASKNLQPQIGNIPIGLVLAAQGGASIESWMCEADVNKYEDQSKLISEFKPDNSVQEYLEQADKNNASWREALETGKENYYANNIPENVTTVIQPGMLKNVQGCFWLYKEIELDKVEEGETLLYLSNLIDVDRTYVNGNLIGRTEYRYPPRKYVFDNSILKIGRNLIAVRILAEHNMGGIVPEHSFFLRTSQRVINLEGEWKFYQETAAVKEPIPSMMGQTIPTALYQSSVVPLRELKFKGMWWYQGETNAERPANYSMQFKDMVETWRKLCGNEFPVALVQMPDYVDPINGPDHNWDLIQESQLNAPNLISNCITVIAKDLGEPQELHPQKKSELGVRFAEGVLKLMYNM